MAPRPFHGERLVLCEGIEDAAFLRQLSEQRNLGEFDVRVVQDFGGVAGISGFKSALINMAPLTGFRNFRHVILVADSDELPGHNFTAVCKQVTAANRDINVAARFTLPRYPFVTARGHPRLTIILNPAKSSKGALETLLWRTIKKMPAYAKIVKCVDAACACAGIDAGRGKWPQSKLDKARVHIAIALINRKNPGLGLVKLWAHVPNLVPVQHTEFNDIANRLAAIV